MKKIALTLLTLFLILSGVAVYLNRNTDFERGFAAHEKGDYATALREWTPLAEQGDVDAQYNLALMYAKGQGVPQDYTVALKWYRLSAEQGNAKAQNNLGVMYGEGRGVPQDDKMAVEWYRRAAEQGNDFAQYNLGAMYEEGEGVLQDTVYAHMWYNIAASSGDEDAAESRDELAEDMTRANLVAAQRLARECTEKNYKGC